MILLLFSAEFSRVCLMTSRVSELARTAVTRRSDDE